MPKKTAKSKTTDKPFEKSVPVFRINPDGHESGVIKHVGYLHENEKLGDEPIEFGKIDSTDCKLSTKYTVTHKKIGDFDITSRIYRCNVVATHIVASARYPVMYLDVGYERPMVSGSLFQLFFSIDINPDEKKAIKENKEYVGLRFNGKWWRHIDCDDELKTNYERMIQEMLETEATELIYKSTDPTMIKSRETMGDFEILEWIDKYVEKEREFYDPLIKDTPIVFRTMRRCREQLIELCTSPRFQKFINIAMKCRDIHRRKDYGIDEEDTLYVVPKQVVKLSDVKQQMIANDEIILDE